VKALELKRLQVQVRIERDYSDELMTIIGKDRTAMNESVGVLSEGIEILTNHMLKQTEAMATMSRRLKDNSVELKANSKEQKATTEKLHKIERMMHKILNNTTPKSKVVSGRRMAPRTVVDEEAFASK
jgi:cystathionine beta-lyase family protein involved in aluminum resistance